MCAAGSAAGRIDGGVVKPFTDYVAAILRPVARAYVAEDAAVVGFHAYRLPREAIPTNKYAAGLWHHDRCGRRLKAYVFLSDVTNDTHPMEVAVGSQDTLFYDYENFPGSRFAHAFVAANYETLKLTGKRGEGFVFDTNALHRAVVDAAADSRSVVLLQR